MNCKNCGAPLEENAKFCGNCGAKVVEEEPAVSEEVKEERTEPEQKTENTEYIPHVEAEKVNPGMNYDSEINTTLWIILGIIDIILCGSKIPGIICLIFAFIALSNKNKGNFEEAKSNIKIAKIAFFIGLVLAILVFVLGIVGSILYTSGALIGY